MQNKINDAMAELLQERLGSRLEDMEVVNNPFSPRGSCNVPSAQKSS
ncbi:MAG: glycosyltransferase [Lachnospiraceae bacterium]|nr:glycosyltransferase [Lachnospiraceae bacterium]